MSNAEYAAIYESALEFFLKQEIDNPKGRTGGHFTVAPVGDSPNEILSVGIPLPSLPSADFAAEKAARLIQNPEHISSFQSRNPEAGQWGGAIRANDQLIFSMSGMPEHVDEAINLSVALKTGVISEARLMDIVNASRNPYLKYIRIFAAA